MKNQARLLDSFSEEDEHRDRETSFRDPVRSKGVTIMEFDDDENDNEAPRSDISDFDSESNQKTRNSKSMVATDSAFHGWHQPIIRDNKEALQKAFDACNSIVIEKNMAACLGQELTALLDIALECNAGALHLSEELELLEDSKNELEERMDEAYAKYEAAEQKRIAECEQWKRKYQDVMEELDVAEQSMVSKSKMKSISRPTVDIEDKGKDVKIAQLERQIRDLSAENRNLEATFNQRLNSLEAAHFDEVETMSPRVVVHEKSADLSGLEAMANENERLKEQVAKLQLEKERISEQLVEMSNLSARRKESDQSNLVGYNFAELNKVELNKVELNKVSGPKKQSQEVAIDIDRSRVTNTLCEKTKVELEPNRDENGDVGPSIPLSIATTLGPNVDLDKLREELAKAKANSEIHLHIHQHGHKHKHTHNASHTHIHEYNSASSR